MQIDEYYDVFISFKDSDGKGNDTKDKAIAHELYTYLSSKNLKVFFSAQTFIEHGTDEWSVELKNVLNNSKIFISVGTTNAYMNSEYLIWERTFFSALRSNDSSLAMYSYIDEPMTLHDLPKDISEKSAFTPKEKERLYLYISNRLKWNKIKNYKILMTLFPVFLAVGYININEPKKEIHMAESLVKVIDIQTKGWEEEKQKNKKLLEENEELKKELLKYKDNTKVHSQANTIKNILGAKEALSYLRSKDKDLYYTEFKQEIKDIKLAKWVKDNLNKVAVLFDTNKTEDKTRIALNITRKGGESETATGIVNLKPSDEYLIIKNSSWSPFPITLKVLDKKGNIVYKDINEEDEDSLFIVSHEVLGDGYRVMVFDGFSDVLVDVRLELK